MADPLRFNGVFHNDPVTGERIPLPLEEVRAKILIVDVSARVTLAQLYTNTSSTAVASAKYVFPVPARAAVCGFEMRTADGRIVKGIAKEKNQAALEYENALKNGTAAGLVEWVTDDMFTISIGAIAPNTRIITKLVYVVDLMDAERTDQVRFQLPMCVGERYGIPRPGLANADAPRSRTRVHITAAIQTGDPILDVSSPTHNITKKDYITHLGRPSRRRMTVSYRSRNYLTGDFVMVVSANGLDKPRCFAEVMPASGGGPTSIALHLTLVPKFKFPPIPRQEYLFVVDRSGSMDGDRIDTAKRTLTMILRMLPSQDSFFNIWSFGWQHSRLWPQSTPYTQQTLDHATSHTDFMQADFGGTEIQGALHSILQSRNHTIPTVVFVLTDGQSSDISNTAATVASAVNSASVQAPLRVMVLGIGDTVSTAMCDAIARAGNGTFLLATAAERIVGQCAKLLRAGRSAFFENVTIDWGFPLPRGPESPTVSFSDMLAPSVSAPASGAGPPRARAGGLSRRTNSPPTIVQSPPRIENLYSGMRFTVSALVKSTDGRPLYVPPEISLYMYPVGGGNPTLVRVPILHAKFVNDKRTSVSMIHVLAARRIMTDILDGRTQAIELTNQIGQTIQDMQKAAVITLGEEYQLASPYTSFVAIDETPVERARQNRERSRDRRWADRTTDGGGSTIAQTDADPLAASFDIPQLSLVSILSSFTGWFNTLLGRRPPESPRSRRSVPGSWRGASASSSSVSEDEDEYDEEDEEDDVPDNSSYTSVDTISTLSSLSSNRSDWSASPRPSRRRRTRPPSPEPQPIPIPPSPTLQPLHNAPHPIQNRYSMHIAVQPPPEQAPPPVPPEVISLVRMQKFDGSFTIDDQFARVVGDRAIAEQATLGDDEKALWGTALAVAYLRKHLASEPDLLHNLTEKAMEFVSQDASVDFFHLVAHASSLLT